ncbi:uncharacterized protein MONBRDRAFT_29325 [Monosiga brevicollis MX1]|uniref:N-alpha-acetyltransferase 35, NatC auxiliary subunit n=1 Tax=Monosiga brevicollis TaxID=81824 RepID=A9VAS3_MONBE|nr:uncharacterized protein MONBRDRAFT_29325 [Monosiga brevicollis MX1]EDQ85370.1 predicted protein [Monosiga brevicollis MX1]|eukprot:XP_001749781.1 hypothetical protein [Monosiga brevicollis MX1]
MAATTSDLPQPPLAEADATDIMDLLRRATADMTTDELLTSDNFTFYKALTSVELGDPRTDAGCSQLLPENECSISLEDALSAGLPVGEFTPRQYTYIAARILQAYLAWLRGNALPVTIMNCMYLVNASCLEDRSMKLLCSAAVRLVMLTVETARQTGIHSEEDFNPQLHGINAAHISKKTTAQFLRALASQTDKTFPTDDSSDGRLLLLILRTLGLLLDLMETIHAPADLKVLESCLQKLDDLVKELLTLANHLEHVLQDSGFQQAPKAQPWQDHAFQHLQASGPTRQLDSLTAIQGLERLRNDIGVIRDTVAQFETSGETLSNIMLSLEGFRQRQANFFARMFIRQIVLPSDERKLFGRLDLSRQVHEAIVSFNGAWCLVHKTDLSEEAQLAVQTFLAEAVETTMAKINLCCENGGRQHRRLAKFPFKLQALYARATLTDATCRHHQPSSVDANLAVFCNKYMLSPHAPSSFPFPQVDPHALSVWVGWRSAVWGIDFLRAGLLLNLYQQHELKMVYWYMEYMSRWTSQCFSKAFRSLQVQAEAKGKGKSKKKHQPKAVSPTMQWHVYDCIFGLARASVLILHAAGKAGRLHAFNTDFINEQCLFSHRFAPFGILEMPPPGYYTTYTEELTAMDKLDVPELFDEAIKTYKGVMASIDAILDQQKPDPYPTSAVRPLPCCRGPHG